MSFSGSIPPQTRGRANSVYLRQLTQPEIQILYHNGIPPAAAQALLSRSSEVMCSIRGNDSAKPAALGRLSFSSYPKPGKVQAKSCNIGPGAGYVAVDPDYSKAEKNEQGVMQAAPRKEGDIPKDQPTLTLRLSLQEIIAKIQEGEYELVSAADGKLSFKLGKNVEAPDNIINDVYQIDLKHVGTPWPSEQKNEDATNIDPHDRLDQPEWWDTNALGDYQALADLNFAVNYKKPNQDEFKPFEILGEQFGNTIVPIVGDLDQFVVGFKSEYLDSIVEKVPSANEPIYAMASNPNGVKQLFDARIELETFLLERERGRKLDPNKYPEDHAAKKEMYTRLSKYEFVKGNITPMESLYSDLMNDKFAKDMPHIQKFFQHASEARNPYSPSKMGRVVFFLDGKISECKGPEEISNFLVTKLPRFQFDIHPKWDMKYFGRVVETQIACGHRVSPETRKSYDQWAESNQAAKSRVGKVSEPLSDEYSKLREQAAEKELQSNALNEKSAHSQETGTTININNSEPRKPGI